MTTSSAGSLLLLRRVDGLSHVALGPPLLAAASPLARLTGVSVGTVVAVLVPFTAYGFAVVVGTRDTSAPPPRWLVPLAVAANFSAVGLGATAAARDELTAAGRLCGVGLAVGGVRMLVALRRR